MGVLVCYSKSERLQFPSPGHVTAIPALDHALMDSNKQIGWLDNPLTLGPHSPGKVPY
jgi:hypothetical protein